MRNITPPGLKLGGSALAWVQRAVIGLIAVLAVWTCFIAVPADSVGVLTRFGKFKDTINPGLRFKLPLGVDQVQIVPIQRQLKLEFGFESPGATHPDQAPDDAVAEKTMLTGDLNMALVEWIVQYRIEDAKTYLFHVYQPGWTLRDAGEAVMREVVGDRTIDEVLTIGRQEIEREAHKRLDELVTKYQLGLRVTQVQLQNVNPPGPVQASFNEVNQAQQEKQQLINQASGEYNKVVPKAKGEAERKLSEAQGYATKRVNEARGDADRFTALFTEYTKAPEVMRQRLYLETMKDVMPQLERKIILDEKARNVLPLLQLEAPRSPLTPSQQPPAYRQ
ncbi:MAG TPA: FtsH protease activity modulator HflK [Chthoniobacteraceae bacterium]|nr:FtsH protease activity modulator HflK [Chthoniobacteraceae bacterium]